MPLCAREVCKKNVIWLPPLAPPTPLSGGPCRFFNLKSFKIWFTGHWEKNGTKTIHLSDRKQTDCVCLTFLISYKTDICLLIGDRGEDSSDESSPRWKPNNIGAPIDRETRGRYLVGSTAFDRTANQALPGLSTREQWMKYQTQHENTKTDKEWTKEISSNYTCWSSYRVVN